MSLEVEVWVAQKAARLTRPLPVASAQALDDELDGALDGLPASRQLRLIEALVLKHTPEEEAMTAHEQAMNSRGVWMSRESQFGTTGVGARLESGDAIRLDAQIARIASILHKGGNSDEIQVLRATALGILASPAQALSLLQADLMDELPDDPEFFTSCPAEGWPGHACGTITTDPDKLLPQTELVVHLTDETLRTRSGLAEGRESDRCLSAGSKTSQKTLEYLSGRWLTETTSCRATLMSAHPRCAK